jgi:hypothetical protein
VLPAKWIFSHDHIGQVDQGRDNSAIAAHEGSFGQAGQTLIGENEHPDERPSRIRIHDGFDGGDFNAGTPFYRVWLVTEWPYRSPMAGPNPTWGTELFARYQ